MTSVSRTSGSLIAPRAAVALLAVSLILLLGSGQAEAQLVDDHGNTTAEASVMRLGSSMEGRVDYANDADVFKLNLSGRSGAVDIWVYTTGETDTIGGLYDSSPNLIASNDDSLIRGRRSNFQLRQRVSPGTYYIVVRSFLFGTGDYTVHAKEVRDPGRTINSATPLELDNPAPGTVDYAGDADYFRLELAESTSLILYALGVDYEPVAAQVFNSAREAIPVNYHHLNIAIRQLRTRAGFLIEDDFDTGTYYIRVDSNAVASSHPVPYTIHVIEDPEYIRFLELCRAGTEALNDPDISDPLYACQWHLTNPDGEDVNVEGVWSEGNMGEGVNIAIVDNGMDSTHEDLTDNVDHFRNHDYTGSGDIHNALQHHGTHLAGIVAARDNDLGVRGLAPRATIYGYNLLVEFTDLNVADAMTRNGPLTAVSNNSWGPPDGPAFDATSALWEEAVDKGLRDGYNGKGTFYTFAGGNGHLEGDSSNLDEYANYYGVTAVCAVNRFDHKSSYSETGANLWICAPSNDSSFAGNGMVTTENSDRYYEDFGGTSAAAPVVSGVAALMRSANPVLTWRDLKLILAASARKVDPQDTGWEEGSRKYGADSDADLYHYNHDYGFGMVDAGAAVELAKAWRVIPPLEEVSAESGSLEMPIPDPVAFSDGATVTSELTLDTKIGFTEFVEIRTDFDHSSFRDLSIELVFPSGAVSELVEAFAPFYNAGVVRLRGQIRLGSAKHLGEDPNGVWQLRVTDRVPSSDGGVRLDGVLSSWGITVYGHERAPGPPVIDSVTGGAGAITVGWSAPSQTAGLEVVAYDLRYIDSDSADKAEANWTLIEDVWTVDEGGDLEHVISGLTRGSRYDVEMRAVNEEVEGPWSGMTGVLVPLNRSPVFDVNDNSAREVKENSPEGAEVGSPVAATDADDDTLTYTLGGQDAGLFDIDGNTGQIRVGPGTALDYETTASYSVEVTATDPSGASDTITVTIMVTDVDLETAYDTNNDEKIDRDELRAAVADFFGGELSREEVRLLVQIFFAG